MSDGSTKYTSDTSVTGNLRQTTTQTVDKDDNAGEIKTKTYFETQSGADIKKAATEKANSQLRSKLRNNSSTASKTN